MRQAPTVDKIEGFGACDYCCGRRTRATPPRPVLAQSGGPGMSALAPLWGLSEHHLAPSFASMPLLWFRVEDSSRSCRRPPIPLYSRTPCVCFEAQTSKHLLGLNLAALTQGGHGREREPAPCVTFSATSLAGNIVRRRNAPGAADAAKGSK
jgi:hypothetical protein